MNYKENLLLEFGSYYSLTYGITDGYQDQMVEEVYSKENYAIANMKEAKLDKGHTNVRLVKVERVYTESNLPQDYMKAKEVAINE